MSKGNLSLLLMMGTGLISGLLLMNSASQITRIQTATVQTGELVQTEQLQGVVGYTRQEAFGSVISGKVAHVHIVPGQYVQTGELLVQLDCSEAERRLSAMIQAEYNRQELLHKADETVSAFLIMQNYEDEKLKQELLFTIEASQIRAESDGYIEELYVEEGEYINASTLLGVIRSAEKCVWSSCDSGSPYELGTVATVSYSKSKPHTAYLSEVRRDPSQENTSYRTTLRFVPIDEKIYEQVEAGKNVAVQIITSGQTRYALLPLSAVTVKNTVWVVENARIREIAIDTSIRNDRYVGLPLEWKGKRVILEPDGYALTDGAVTKEYLR